MSSELDRLELSRLVHRFGFGPKPGQYRELLNAGIENARATILSSHVADPGLARVVDPHVTNMGEAPSGKAASEAYWRKVWNQYMTMSMWWLDRMVHADHPLNERMTWFWHGHWATSIGKVGFALPMKRQNETLRKYALGNFADMSRAMIVDGALIYWLDGEVNVKDSPNENLAREFMELFTLGVGHYSESDVKAAAKGLTGYQVVDTSGRVTFDPSQHDYSKVRLLGAVKSFTAPTISDLVVAREESARYIARRMWFRFVSSTLPAPGSLTQSFAHRNIASLAFAVARNPVMRRPGVSLAKSPVEWFVGACKALRVAPSKLDSGAVSWYLGQMGQFPFNPPNVGGWPYDEAWLTASSAQYRFSMAQYLVEKGNVAPLGKSRAHMVNEAADWLGVARWSARTEHALRLATSDPAQLAVLAICAPEYVVSV